MTDQDKLTQILWSYHNEPLKFFRDILKVDLDKQQAKLVHHACKQGSRVMVKSARGTGKSFIITGLTLYFLVCFKDVTVTILSPSEQQLKTVFMREIRKHISNMDPLFADYYDIRSMSIYNKHEPLNEAHCVTASVERSENVSGRHSDKQIYLLDEASAIPDSIYSTTLGSLGTAIGDGHFIGVSNPNLGNNQFYVDLFEKRPDKWKLMTFTAFDCPRISKNFIEEQKELYGEDGDEYRISVLGEFPRADGSSFIPPSLIEDASQRSLLSTQYNHEQTIMGVDVARSLSGDKTVFIVRRGLKLVDIIAFKTEDTMETVSRVLDAIRNHDVDVIYGDATGVGGPVFDRLRQMITHIPVVDVVVGNKATDPLQYANVRTQLWGEMRSWLSEADIPDHYELKKELREMTWGYTNKMQMQLTAKKQLKQKGIQSPDHADALALTFYGSCHTMRQAVVQPREIKMANVLWV